MIRGTPSEHHQRITQADSRGQRKQRSRIEQRRCQNRKQQQHRAPQRNGHHRVERGDHFHHACLVERRLIRAFQRKHAVLVGLVVDVARLHHAGTDGGEHRGKGERQETTHRYIAHVQHRWVEWVVVASDSGGEQSAHRRHPRNEHSERHTGHVTPSTLGIVEDTAHGNHSGRVLRVFRTRSGAHRHHPGTDDVHHGETEEEDAEDDGVDHHLTQVRECGDAVEQQVAYGQHGKENQCAPCGRHGLSGTLHHAKRGDGHAA